MNKVAYNKAIQFVEAAIAPLGYECLDIEWDARESTLRVFIDSHSGITMEDCLKVNSLLVENADLDDIFSGDYRLEISSPGVERPLRKQEHFAKYIGHIVKIKLYSQFDGRSEGSGKILDRVENGLVFVELPTGPWSFPIEAVRSARLVYEW